MVLGSHLGKKYMGTSGGKGKGGVIVNVASMAGRCISQFGCEIQGEFWWERKRRSNCECSFYGR